MSVSVPVRGTGHAPVPRRRWLAARRARAPVRPPEALPRGRAGADGGSKAAVPLRPGKVAHGAEAMISGLARRGLSGPDPRGRTTLRFSYSSDTPVEVSQLDDRGIDDV